MNNKSDKKQKRKQKQTKHKKKTASHKSKTKKEIKGGGKGWFKSFFSRNTSPLKQPLLQKSNSTINQSSSASPNPQSSVSSPNPQPLTNAVSSTGSYNLTTKITSNQNNWNNHKLSQLQQPLLPKSNSLANAQPTNSNNSQRSVSQAQSPANLNNSQRSVSQTLTPANLNNSQRSVSQAQSLVNLNNSQRSVSQTLTPANSGNPQQNATQPPPPPPPPPNAQPQGFKTIESQSRCSIQ